MTFRITKEEWIANRRLSTADVIDRLPAEAKEHAYIVGAWVWIEFPVKPKQEILNQIKDLGFRYSKKRKAWQHPCGVFRSKAPYDPKDKYGVTAIEEQEPVTA